MLRGHIAAADFAESCSIGGAVQSAFAFIVGIVIRRIANSSRADSDNATALRAEEIPDDFYRQKLREALGEGVEALNDPEIEKRVEAYFRENPSFSRDAVHVAAVACQFKKEQIVANRRHEETVRQETFSQSPVI